MVAPEFLPAPLKKFAGASRVARSKCSFPIFAANGLRSKTLAPEMPTKTGMMLGLGEEKHEVLAAMQDLVAQGTAILTLGQYLQPTREHLPVVRFVHPAEFAEYKVLGEAMGFKHVESGPLVRSSYHAFEQEAAAHV